MMRRRRNHEGRKVWLIPGDHEMTGQLNHNFKLASLTQGNWKDFFCPYREPSQKLFWKKASAKNGAYFCYEKSTAWINLHKQSDFRAKITASRLIIQKSFDEWCPTLKMTGLLIPNFPSSHVFNGEGVLGEIDPGNSAK